MENAILEMEIMKTTLLDGLYYSHSSFSIFMQLVFQFETKE